ncbi:MAG TPA: N-acyl homoserine lactonase family protein [Capillimicrobium sp.]|nr:N-acyl homoserine lactonase family protein [Capillimicrobium sp.]
MPVAAEPKPLTGPLPGGRSGATVRVRPLLGAEIMAPPAFWSRPGGPLWLPRAFLARRSTWVPVPIPAFLVDHPTAGAILVDTGLHASVAGDPRDNLGRLGAAMYDIRMRPEQAIPAQLEALGVDPHEVRIVVMTHLHYDHASGVSQFPNATFVVSRAEWEAASTLGARQGYRSRQFDHAFDWRTIDYEHADLESFATFGRSFDLLGDGSVRLVFTPGHTPGHQSLVLRLGDRELLLTGDAAHRRRAIDDGELQLLCADDHLYRRSLGEIRRYVQQTPGAEVICGHDPEGWAALREVYS